MSYTGSFIKQRGQVCTISRTPSVTSYVSMVASTKGYSDNRDLYREGLILAASSLAAGEVFTVGSEVYLVRSIYTDKQSGELAFFASKVNAVLVHKRLTEATEGDYGITRDWSTITETVNSTVQLVSAALRQYEPGLLPTTKWLFDIPSSVSLKLMDRMELSDGGKCQVEHIDSVRLPGILRVQCSVDRR
jgi:hypothetical protein